MGKKGRPRRGLGERCDLPSGSKPNNINVVNFSKLLKVILQRDLVCISSPTDEDSSLSRSHCKSITIPMPQAVFFYIWLAKSIRTAVALLGQIIRHKIFLLSIMKWMTQGRGSDKYLKQRWWWLHGRYCLRIACAVKPTYQYWLEIFVFNCWWQSYCCCKESTSSR